MVVNIKDSHGCMMKAVYYRESSEILSNIDRKEHREVGLRLLGIMGYTEEDYLEFVTANQLTLEYYTVTRDKHSSCLVRPIINLDLNENKYLQNYKCPYNEHSCMNCNRYKGVLENGSKS